MRQLFLIVVRKCTGPQNKLYQCLEINVDKLKRKMLQILAFDILLKGPED